jgi:hypothetical protein
MGLTLIKSEPGSIDVIIEAFGRSLRGASLEYRARHLTRWENPAQRDVFAAALANTLSALGEYADAYHRRYRGSRLGEDGVLGEEWQQMLRGFVGLLNGETGGLDAGALDAAARDLHRWAGFEDEL